MKLPSITQLLCGGLAFACVACIARGPEDYRKVTRELVDTKQSDIKSCYGDSAGKVVINFTVEKKSGKVTNPALDTDKSTVDASVGECVAKAIDGMQIDRADMRDGAAAFTWTYGV